MSEFAVQNFCPELHTENLGEMLALTQRSVNRILKELNM